MSDSFGVLNNGTVLEGSTVIITCKVHGMLPPLDISWTTNYHYHSHFLSSKIEIRTVGNHSEYIIVKTTRQDSGAYVCNATDAKNELSLAGSAVLNVQGKFIPFSVT